MQMQRSNRWNIICLLSSESGDGANIVNNYSIVENLLSNRSRIRVSPVLLHVIGHPHKLGLIIALMGWFIKTVSFNLILKRNA